MILRGLADWSLAPEMTVLVGDKASDVGLLCESLGARFPDGG